MVLSASIKFAESSRVGGKWTTKDFLGKYLTILSFAFDLSKFKVNCL